MSAPADAVCIEDGCRNDATCERLAGLVPVSIDADPFCWMTELVCPLHVEPSQ